MEETKALMINGAIVACLWAWALLSSDCRLQPLQMGTMAFFIRIFLKLNKINPSPENPENPDKAKMDKVSSAPCVFALLGQGIACIM